MPIKLVIIEDDIDDRLFISGALEESGEIDIVGFAENFEELTRILKNSNAIPDGVLCDIRLPGSTGWELSEKCKQLAGCAEVPFVLMSGVLPERMRTATASNIAGYILKPSLLTEYRLFKQQLLEAIQQYKAARQTNWLNWAPRFFGTRQRSSYQPGV